MTFLLAMNPNAREWHLNHILMKTIRTFPGFNKLNHLKLFNFYVTHEKNTNKIVVQSNKAVKFNNKSTSIQFKIAFRKHYNFFFLKIKSIKEIFYLKCKEVHSNQFIYF